MSSGAPSCYVPAEGSAWCSGELGRSYILWNVGPVDIPWRHDISRRGACCGQNVGDCILYGGDLLGWCYVWDVGTVDLSLEWGFGWRKCLRLCFELHGRDGLSMTVGLLRLLLGCGNGAEKCQRHHKDSGEFYSEHDVAFSTRRDHLNPVLKG
jgi:hypothetical protein